MENDLGRFVRGLKERCPSCSTPLQVRAVKVQTLVRGVELYGEEELIQCPVCGYEEKIKNPKKRIEHVDKTDIREPLKDKKEGKNGYHQRCAVKNDYRAKGSRGSGSNNR